MTIVKVTYMTFNGKEKSIDFTSDHFAFPLSVLNNYDLIVVVMDKFKTCFKSECEIIAVEIIAR